MKPKIEVEVQYTITCQVPKEEQKDCDYFRAISKEKITECSFCNSNYCASSALNKYVTKKINGEER